MTQDLKKELRLPFYLGFFGGAVIMFAGLLTPLIMEGKIPPLHDMVFSIAGGALLWSCCGIVAALYVFREQAKEK